MGKNKFITILVYLTVLVIFFVQVYYSFTVKNHFQRILVGLAIVIIVLLIYIPIGLLFRFLYKKYLWKIDKKII